MKKTLTKREKSVTEFAGFLSDKAASEMLKSVRKLRKKSSADIEREKMLASLW